MSRRIHLLIGGCCAAVIAVLPIPSYLLWQRAELTAQQEREAAAETECIKLANLHDFEGLDVALSLERVSGRCRRVIAYGFASPEGREFVLTRITDPSLSMERRQKYVHVLAVGGPEYHSVCRNIERNGASDVTVGGTGNGQFLERIAKVASNSRADEEFCVALLDGLGDLSRGAGFHPSDAVLADRAAAVTPLKELHSDSSDRVKFRVEEAVAELDRVQYDSLPPKCGPILSEVRRAEPKHYGPARGELKYEYRVRFLDGEPLTQPELVAVSVKTAKEQVLSLSPFPLRGRGQVGMNTLPISDDVPRGRYRIFFRFSRDGQVVSEGYGFETEW